MAVGQQTFFNNEEVNARKQNLGKNSSYSQEIEWGGECISASIALSMLFKTARICDAHSAIHWYLVLRQKFNWKPFALGKVLNQLNGEDNDPDEACRLYPMIQAFFYAIENNYLNWHQEFQLVYNIAMAKKWYQTEKGKHLEMCRQASRGLLNGKGEKGTPQEELTPEAWAYDIHTREFWNNLKNDDVDFRLCGSWQQRFNISNRWDKLKENSGDLSFEELVQDWIEIHKEPQTDLDREVSSKAIKDTINARNRSKGFTDYKCK